MKLVPADTIKLSLGSVVAADAHLLGGSVLLDHSMLTGESLPIHAGPGLETYARALVRRGEALAEVTATGTHTKFGRTAELVRTAHVTSTQQKAVFRVVRNLAGFNGLVTVLTVAYAYTLGLPIIEIIPLVLICNAALHAFAAENEARMEAMAAAHNQIERQLSALRARQQNVRQEEITAEIIELAAGETASRSGYN
jgi:cation transport ATPase